MKLVKRFLQVISILFVTVVLWLILSPTGPRAKEFCDSHPVGSTFERSSAIREMSNIKGGYLVRVVYQGGEISFHGDVVLLGENSQTKRISLDEALALQPRDVETFRVTSTGFSKRSCEVTVSAGKVVESKTWTWD